MVKKDHGIRTLYLDYVSPTYNFKERLYIFSALLRDCLSNDLVMQPHPEELSAPRSVKPLVLRQATAVKSGRYAVFTSPASTSLDEDQSTAFLCSSRLCLAPGGRGPLLGVPPTRE